MITYQVKKGDTLWSVSRAFNTTIEKLAADNNIENPDLIHVGQILQINAIDPEQSIVQAAAACLEAIEKLPEFKALEALLDGN